MPEEMLCPPGSVPMVTSIVSSLKGSQGPGGLSVPGEMLCPPGSVPIVTCFPGLLSSSLPRDWLPCELHCNLDTGLRGGSMFLMVLPAVPGSLPLPYSQAVQPRCPFCLPRPHPGAAPLPRPGPWNLALLPLCPLGLSEHQLFNTPMGPLIPVLSLKVCISVLKMDSLHLSMPSSSLQ